jgi:hypothetical protein|tara:strand:+ start:2018 stop:2302 length:285 start_codon:yes stop_codon:yes gene_type:complete
MLTQWEPENDEWATIVDLDDLPGFIFNASFIASIEFGPDNRNTKNEIIGYIDGNNIVVQDNNGEFYKASEVYELIKLRYLRSQGPSKEDLKDTR